MFQTSLIDQALTCPDPNGRCINVNSVKEHIREYAEWWRASDGAGGTEDQPMPTAAWLISLEDMLIAFRYDPTTHTFADSNIRAYLGLHAREGEELKRLHLFFIPTYEDNGVYRDTAILGTDGNLYLMDLVVPCPSLCDTEGELFQTYQSHLPAGDDRKDSFAPK